MRSATAIFSQFPDAATALHKIRGRVARQMTEDSGQSKQPPLATLIEDDVPLAHGNDEMLSSISLAQGFAKQRHEANSAYASFALCIVTFVV